MDEQDMKSFNEWHRDNRVFPNDNETASGYANRYAKEAWQAALEYRDEQMKGTAITYQSMYEQERERSKKLVEALEKIIDDFDSQSEGYKMFLCAEKALKQYRGEK